MITVTVDKKYCKGCNLCIANCPLNVLAVSTVRGSAGFMVPEAARPEACNRCQLCEVICPDFAIVVEGDREK